MKYIVTEEQIKKVETEGQGQLNNIIKKIFMMEFPDFKDDMFVHYSEQSNDYFLIFPKTSITSSLKERIIKKLKKILGPVEIIIFSM